MDLGPIEEKMRFKLMHNVFEILLIKGLIQVQEQTNQVIN